MSVDKLVERLLEKSVTEGSGVTFTHIPSTDEWRDVHFIADDIMDTISNIQRRLPSISPRVSPKDLANKLDKIREKLEIVEELLEKL